jgi:uncharacterized membrane protein
MRARILYALTITSLVLLIALGVAVELWLAPLRPEGSWLALKVIPLVVALPGNLRRHVYTMQWSSMLILLYFAEGLVSATSSHGPSAVYGAVEAALALVYFVSALAVLFPIKRRARAARAAFPSE